MNLFTAEVKRLFARRFTWVMLLVTVGILGLVVLGITLNSQRPSPDVVAQAEQQAAQYRADTLQMREECEEAQRSGDPSRQFEFPPGLTCAEAFNPDQIQAADFMPHTFAFRDEVPTLLQVLGGIVALFGFAVGASFVGAEWNSGGMTNLLLWRPRRIPVLLTKLGTVLAAVVAIGTVVGGVYLAGLWVAARVRGRMGQLDADFWQSLALVGARSLTLALAATTIGFALASLGRHTAPALGIGVGYLIVGEAGTSIVLALAEVAKPERFQLSSYVAAWLGNGATFQSFGACSPDEPCQPETWRLDLGDAATVGGVILVVLVAAAVWQMRRRDVT
jgi:ABC-2 type transport system permease protein